MCACVCVCVLCEEEGEGQDDFKQTTQLMTRDAKLNFYRRDYHLIGYPASDSIFTYTASCPKSELSTKTITCSSLIVYQTTLRGKLKVYTDTILGMIMFHHQSKGNTT